MLSEVFMPLVQLTLALKDNTLSVRSFEVRDAISGLFQASVVARSEDGSVDLESIVGQPAALLLAGGGNVRGGAGRAFSGVCSRAEQLQGEASGLSTYRLQIVPRLWLLAQRRNNRIFQHASVPEIVEKLLAEWAIQPSVRIDRGRYPKLEYRVQYGETDFAFIVRLLEEAGISYFFSDDGEVSTLVLADQPQAAEQRPGGPIAYVDNPSGEGLRDFVTNVVLAHEVRPGKYTIRDFDFRGRPTHPHFGAMSAGEAAETRYEQYHYVPGGFIDDKDGVRADERAANTAAGIALEAMRASKREVTFHTNVLDLAPGVVFSMDGHTHTELDHRRPLLVVEATLQGTVEGEWTMGGRAVSAEQPYRPARVTPKPRIYGVQSAIVVGPKGEEIHTDKLGRVRVQFHWDREGSYDDQSSCWVRVSQGWAGAGYGFIMIPRVGHEVLIGFFEGDPDQPVVIGRGFNGESTVPYPLPADKTVSTWKSSSSPHSGGFNEIKFEDKRGQELVYVQAQRNLEKLVKVNEAESTGVDRTIAVGANRTTTVGTNDTSVIGALYSVTMAQRAAAGPTQIEMVDSRIVLTTGEASITLEGPNITLAAKGVITIKSDGDDVVIQGGPWVKINCGAQGDVASDTVTMHHITGILRDQDSAPLAGRKVVVKASDGSVQTVETDASGRYFAIIPEGKCQVSLPGDLRYGTKGPEFDDMTLDPEHFDDCGPAV